MISPPNDSRPLKFDSFVMFIAPDLNVEAGAWLDRLREHFAKSVPVICVHMDQSEPRAYWESAQTCGRHDLHVYRDCGTLQSRLINAALCERRFLMPLIWINSRNLFRFVEHRYSPLIAYHAMESPFDRRLAKQGSEYVDYDMGLRSLFDAIDLLVAGSEEIRRECVKNGKFKGRTMVMPDEGGASVEQAGKVTSKSHDDITPAARASGFFSELDSNIRMLLQREVARRSRFNVLVLYDDQSTHVGTTRDYIESFGLYSRHRIFYAVPTEEAVCTVDLSAFNVIVIHYSVRLSLKEHLSRSWAEALTACGAYKVLFIQDDYETTEVARTWIQRLGVHCVFTPTPAKAMERVYPHSLFPSVEFHTILLGFVPIEHEEFRRISIRDRSITLGYRGRSLPFWYGRLGQEKVEIGKRMREICEGRGIHVDIEWTEKKRIYGEQWFEFLSDCKAMLGSESGSDVIDSTGEIRSQIEKEIRRNPEITFEEVHRRYLTGHEERVPISQISPKVFEAIANRTALVLFEGNYSDVVLPDRHFIPLKKDFSNIEDVLRKLVDDQYLEAMTERAYEDIIRSGSYGYERFIHDLDRFLENRIRRSFSEVLFASLVGWRRNRESEAFSDSPGYEETDPFYSSPTNIPICVDTIRRQFTINFPFKERVLIFGAAAGGSLAFATLEEMNMAGRVVGVCDNDPAKQGALYHGQRISRFEDILRTSYDFVIVASVPGRKAIVAQLREVGLAKFTDYLTLREIRLCFGFRD